MFADQLNVKTVVMETVRGYLSLPRLQLPSLAQLRDGSFLSKAVQKYEQEKDVSILKDFEVRETLKVNKVITRLLMQLLKMSQIMLFKPLILSFPP